jgi:hypothetical protein
MLFGVGHVYLSWNIQVDVITPQAAASIGRFIVVDCALTPLESGRTRTIKSPSMYWCPSKVRA